VLTALSPAQQVVKIVRDELIQTLGSQQVKLRFSNDPPSVMFIVGLQGSGKTTTAGKLARWLERNGHSPLMVSVDVYRPAARKQLSVIGREIKLPVYEGTAEEREPVELGRAARREAANSGRDVLLVDTAGRLHIDEELMQELVALKQSLAPIEILFVADAMTGQDAVRSAEEFHRRLGITGVILTKMDGDARGGAALSIRAVTGQPLKFVGVGERPDALEPFHPDRVASRILGMGDVLSMIEKVEEQIDQRQAEELSRRLLEEEFTLEDFRDQLRQLRKLGPLESILGMMPQIGPLKNLKDVRVDEKQITRLVAIVDSMTLRERANHSLINGSRRRRIARGSGTTVQEVNVVLRQYVQMRKMMRNLTRGGPLGRGLGRLKLTEILGQRL